MNSFHISYEVVNWRTSHEKRISLHTQIDINRYATQLFMSAMWKDSIRTVSVVLSVMIETCKNNKTAVKKKV